MREIKSHIVEGSNEQTAIFAVDTPTEGGACHEYGITVKSDIQEMPVPTVLDRLGYVRYQKGSIKEAGINGVQGVHLLAIEIDRLEHFQSGPFASTDNQEALEHIRAALKCLHRRTKDRLARNVEGYNKV